MIVKIKSYFLKDNVNPDVLTNYGFITLNDGDSYWKYDLLKNGFEITFYKDTRRFSYFNFAKSARAKKVKKYILDLINNDLVEIKNNYEWWAFIGRWQNYSADKIKRIKDKLEKLNKGVSNE
jgi:hypothetical protein